MHGQQHIKIKPKYASPRIFVFTTVSVGRRRRCCCSFCCY